MLERPRLQILSTLLACLVTVAVATVIDVSPPASRADAQESAPEAGTRGYAEVIADAVAALQAKDFPLARTLFAQAHSMQPSARTLRGLGMAEFELRNYRECVIYLEQALASTERPLTAELRAETEQLLARARQFTAHLKLAGVPDNATVTVDGRTIQLGENGQLVLEIGDHVLEVSAAGYQPERRALTVRGGELAVLPIDLDAMITASEPAPTASSAPSARTERPPNYDVIRIFYATDRERTRSGVDRDYYGIDRKNGAGLWLGTCDVSIPKSHRMGRIERPTILKFEFREDPEKHVTLVDIVQRSYADYYTLLKERVAGSSRKDVLVFVHGFYVDFRDAALRTAQLAHDLAFEGAPVLYSWPSQARLLSYTVDENNATWTTPHLVTFLRDLQRRTGAERIHIVAHSMGNRPVVDALRTLARTPGSAATFRNAMLMAPDIDADTFRESVRELSGAVSRVTLYASSNDQALLLSQMLHRYPRAGDAGDTIVVLSGLDTIDASAADTSFLGHSYFSERRSILNDVFYLLTQEMSPTRRANLAAMQSNGGRFYRFRP